MKIIFDYNRTLFDPDSSALYPGTREVLEKLSKKYKLFLVSQNEPLREQRFYELDLGKFFQEIYFVEKKTLSLFRRIISGEEKSVIVGDSIASEITLGNQLRCTTIRLHKGIFATVMPEDRDQIATHNIYNLNELESLLQDL
jgi:FMN phosphatase YigB (HAD superfamily)